jgi:hypothetical protein
MIMELLKGQGPEWAGRAIVKEITLDEGFKFWNNSLCKSLETAVVKIVILPQTFLFYLKDIRVYTRKMKNAYLRMAGVEAEDMKMYLKLSRLWGCKLVLPGKGLVNWSLVNKSKHHKFPNRQKMSYKFWLLALCLWRIHWRKNAQTHMKTIKLCTPAFTLRNSSQNDSSYKVTFHISASGLFWCPDSAPSFGEAVSASAEIKFQFLRVYIFSNSRFSVYKSGLVRRLTVEIVPRDENDLFRV